jgi:hypothetical protein
MAAATILVVEDDELMRGWRGRPISPVVTLRGNYAHY